MWISKREYRELQDLKKRVDALCKAHNFEIHPHQILGGRWYDEIDRQIYYTCNHNNVDLTKAKVNISNYQVRFDELADYMMQNKPIVRAKTIDVEITPKKCNFCFKKNCNKKAGV